MESQWYCIAVVESTPMCFSPEDDYLASLADSDWLEMEDYPNGCVHDQDIIGYEIAQSPIDALEQYAKRCGYQNATDCFYLYENSDERISVVAYECLPPETEPG